MLLPSLETVKVTCKQTQAIQLDDKIHVVQQPHCPTAQQTASQPQKESLSAADHRCEKI